MGSFQISIIALIDIFFLGTLPLKILYLFLYNIITHTLLHTHYYTHTITHIIKDTHYYTHIFFRHNEAGSWCAGGSRMSYWLAQSKYLRNVWFLYFFKFAFFQTMTSALLLFYFHLIIIFYFIFTFCGCVLLSVRLIL